MIYVSQDEYQLMQNSLCVEVERYLGRLREDESEDLKVKVCGVSRGGLIPAVKLSHWLNVPMEVVNLGSSGDKDTRHNFRLNKGGIPDYHVLWDCDVLIVVDDVVVTGQTICFLKKFWENSMRQENQDRRCIGMCPSADWNMKVVTAVLVCHSENRDLVDIAVKEVNGSGVWIYFPHENRG